MGSISRRSFLTGSAVAAGAFASLGIAGCSPKKVSDTAEETAGAAVAERYVRPSDAELRRKLTRMQKSMWGISVRNSARLDHLEFVIRADEDEDYIISRLYREKRCGEVERIDDNHYRFSCDVYDAGEMVPWLRTFICRITAFSCSDRKMERQFLDDIDAMFRLYGIGERGEDE